MDSIDEIIKQHLGVSSKDDPTVMQLLQLFNQKRAESDATLAIDQLLNAIFLARSGAEVNPLDHQGIKDAIFKSLSETPQAPTL